jgi:type I restriction enzyme S subunit
MEIETSDKVLHIPSTASELPASWKWRRLDDVCEGIFDCPHSTPKLTLDGLYVVRSQDIRSGVFRLEEAGRVTEETYLERIKRVEPRYGDLLYSREGTYFGIAAEVPRNIRVCLGQRMVLIRPKAKYLNFRFLRYWLNSPVLAAHIYGHRDGTVAERLNLPTIRGLPVPVAPLVQQQAIAQILGTLDDKIELNQQMNHTLEVIARTIFKSWFIDFDPVRAKMDGQQPAGMDAETAALFPAEFEDSALGKIPKGWKVKTLSYFIDIKHGYAFKGEFFRDQPPGDILLTPGNFAMGGGFKDDKFKYYIGEVPEEFVLAKGDLLITMTDLSKLGDTLGYPAIIPTEREGRYLHNQRLGKVIIKCENSISKFYLYYLLTTNEYRHEILAGATGTTVKHTSPGRIQAFRFCMPTSELSLRFDGIVASLFDKMLLNNDEKQNLTSIRDALLPKLLSGDVYIKDVEKFLLEEGNP